MFAYRSALRIDFEDTYDGLGDQLEEAGDDLNEDTFGGGDNGPAKATAPQQVGKDFDFFGQTAKVSDAINEEQMRFSRQQAPIKQPSPQRQSSRPYRTGYEAYQRPDYVPDLQVNASLWGTAPPIPVNVAGQENIHQGGARASPGNQPPRYAAPNKKMMSLEEVEAAMRSQAKKPNPSPVPQHQAQLFPSQSRQDPQYGLQQGVEQPQIRAPQPQSQSASQQRVQHQQTPSQGSQPRMSTTVAQPRATPQILQRGEQLPQPMPDRDIPQPRHILQNQRRPPAQLAPRPPEPTMPLQSQPRVPVTGPTGTTHSIPIITHPQQLMQLSEEEREAFLHEDAKRAKRNHKIYLLSKDNGLMTPQDKNFITRIQLGSLDGTLNLLFHALHMVVATTILSPSHASVTTARLKQVGLREVAEWLLRILPHSSTYLVVDLVVKVLRERDVGVLFIGVASSRHELL